MIHTAPPEKKTPGDSPKLEDLGAHKKPDEVLISLPHIMSQFRDIRGNKRISLKVLLLSGTSATEIKAKVINNGYAVLIQRKYPRTFVSVSHHIQNLKNMTNHHIHFSETDGRITAFHDAVSKL